MHNLDISQIASAAAINCTWDMRCEPVVSQSHSTAALKTPRKALQVVAVLSAEIGVAAIRDRYQKDVCHGNARAAKLLQQLLFRYQPKADGSPRLKTYRYDNHWWEKSYADWAEELDLTEDQVRTDFKNLKKWGLAEARPLRVYDGVNKGKTVIHSRVFIADGAASLSGWPDYSQTRIILEWEKSHPYGMGKVPLHTDGKFPIHKTKEETKKKNKQKDDKAYKHADQEPSAKYSPGETSTGQRGKLNPDQVERSESTLKPSSKRPARTPGKLLPPENPDSDPWADYRDIESRHDMNVLLQLCIDGQFVPDHWTMLSNDLCKSLLRIEQALAPVSRDYCLEEIIDFFGHNHARANEVWRASKEKPGCAGVWDYVAMTGWEGLACLRDRAADPKQGGFCYNTKPNLASLASSMPVILEWLGPCTEPIEEVPPQPLPAPEPIIGYEAATYVPPPTPEQQAAIVAATQAWVAEQQARKVAALKKAALSNYHA